MEKIFIIDDEDDFSIIIGNFLKENGYEITLFKKSDEGLAAIEAQCPDLVIADLYIENEKSGISLTNQIKKINPEIPVIILTGMGSGFIEMQKEICRADIVIKKPYKKEFLLHEIRRLTNARQTI